MYCVVCGVGCARETMFDVSREVLVVGYLLRQFPQIGGFGQHVPFPLQPLVV